MAFKEMNLAELAELDRSLSDKEREEWNAIYASYRSASIMSGSVAGVDLHEMKYVPEGKVRAVTRTARCLIVIKYRVKVIIPETEVFIRELSTGYHVLHSMCGANIYYVITHIDREAGFAIASRKLALERFQAAYRRRPPDEGRTVNVDILSVGRNMCTVHYRGYDCELAQRDVSYNTVSDLREVIHPGEVRKAVIKEFDKENGELQVSIKEATPHPFDGVETRHPIGSTRIATIVSKYAGGVYCRLFDGRTDVLCSYEAMQYDGDFKVGDSVEIIIRKYNAEKRIVFGKILRKMRSR